MNLNQITLPAIDVESSVRFYKTMGFEQIVADDGYARFICPEGDTSFSIHAVKTLYPENEMIVYFECQQLDETVTKLKSLGVAFEQEPVVQAWLWREAYLRDPAGNRLCLYSAGDNRKNPPWRLPKKPASG
ncbi:MAG: VOC family protein [Gammaproteobacteria bacterium]|nr:VOC family protein [Gammaproteobacteria bacterium]MDH5728980.1 VOC family protein [Gammaproteobacteria bacterium]